MTIKTRIVYDENEFALLKEQWEGLFNNSVDGSIYLTYQWIYTWWQHFGKKVELNLVIFEEDDKIIGIVPLMVKKYRLVFINVNALEVIGANNINHVGLFLRGHEKKGIEAFFKYIREELSNRKLILRLSFVPDDYPVAHKIYQYMTTGTDNFGVYSKLVTLAPYIPLPSSWDEYYGSIGRRRRKVLKRSLGALEKKHRVDFGFFDDTTLNEGLKTLFNLHQARWESENVRGIFSGESMRNFYAAVAREFMNSGWLRFSYLTIDDEIAYVEFNYELAGKLYSATAARNIKFAEYGVGHIHQMYLIKYAINNNLTEIDLLKGDEPYKLYWAKSARKYHELLFKKRNHRMLFPSSLLFRYFRFCEILQQKYTVRELYSLYMRKRKEQKEKRNNTLILKA